MFRGEKINVTEDRAVLHTALRAPRDAVIEVDGENVVPGVHAVLDKMAVFADRVRSGEWTGHTGKRIKNVVNIGIGGSDLGPAMAYEALRPFTDRDLTFRFVSNVDGADLHEAVRDLDPAETLFVIASKTFTTIETITNATSARNWLLAGLGGDEAAVAKHFVALSTNAEKVTEFGIDTANMFEFWDWVGGRYSYDSAIGLSLMIAIGPDHFREMLAGFHLVDEHFRTAPAGAERAAAAGPARASGTATSTTRSRTRCCRTATTCRKFTAYLQQLDMESNGKSVDRRRRAGRLADRPGGLGHAGHQRAARVLPVAAPGHQGHPGGLHRLRPSRSPNCGAARRPARPADGQLLRPDPGAGLRQDPGGGRAPRACRRSWCRTRRSAATTRRPPSSPTELTPSVLGQLIALYEHKVFVQGAIWDIDSFDQWGVELGKVLAKRIEPALTEGAEVPGTDSSTAGLVARYRELRGR